MGPLGGSTLLSVAALSTVKFMVAPALGRVAGLSFIETVGANTIGAWLSCALSYLLAATLFERARRKRLATEPKRSFTRLNKLMVRVKRSRFGFLIMVIFGPSWLSVPFGTLVVTKFYGERRYALPAMMLSLFLWSCLLSGIVYSASA